MKKAILNSVFLSWLVTVSVINAFSQSCDETVSFSSATVTPSELSALLADDGVNGELTGNYAYKVVINGGGGYYTHTEMMTCLDGVIPTAGYAKGESDDGDAYRTQIGTDPTLQNLFNFNNMGWIDVTSYISSDELFYILDSKWGTDIDTWIYFWFSTNQPISEFGYGLLDEYNDDFGSITVDEYTITVGIETQFAEWQSTIFPNPTNGTFKLQMSGINMGKYQINLIDNYGKIIESNNCIISNESFETEFSLDGSSNGIYLLMVVNLTTGESFYKKIIKK